MCFNAFHAFFGSKRTCRLYAQYMLGLQPYKVLFWTKKATGVPTSKEKPSKTYQKCVYIIYIYIRVNNIKSVKDKIHTLPAEWQRLPASTGDDNSGVLSCWKTNCDMLKDVATCNVLQLHDSWTTESEAKLVLE